jgi:hypothetical protein
MAQYGPELWWYNDESLAVNVPAHVFPRGSNIHASIFSDAALTVPLANPTTTDGAGVLTFYAAPGDYWLQLNDIPFDVTINDGNDESWHTTFVHEQTIAASTWTITHNLGTNPDVEVSNAADTVVVFTEVNYVNANVVQVKFNTPQTGFARLRR